MKQRRGKQQKKLMELRIGYLKINKSLARLTNEKRESS